MASLKINNIIPAPSLTQLQVTLTSLQTATHILAGLTHRNKNQHRGTKWWASFDMLRRSVNKLMPDLEGAIKRAEVVPPSSNSSKRKKKAPDGSLAKTAAAAPKQPELERFVDRAVWVREVLAGRAYEAFTRLTADRQFAQLGLVLIGVLAQVEAAIEPFTPAGPDPDPEEASVPMQSGVIAVAQSEDALRLANIDVGVAVSRDELLNVGRDNVHQSIEPSNPPLSEPRPLSKGWRDPDSVKNKKRKKAIAEDDRLAINPTSPIELKKRKTSTAVEAEVSLNSSIKDTAFKGAKKERKLEVLDNVKRTDPESKVDMRETTREAKKAKKKKKKKGSDEFDDLFSSLL